jgi:hypothetical protein
MANLPPDLDLILSRQMVNLNARMMALQMMMEGMLMEIQGERFDRKQFQQELNDLTARYREKIMLNFEDLNPEAAAFLDATLPPPREDPSL